MKKSLYYSTTLWSCLDALCDIKDRNERNDLIYSPGIVAVKSGGDEPVRLTNSERRTFNVITGTAPDASECDSFFFTAEADDPEIKNKWTAFREDLYRKKIRNILRCAEDQGTDILIVPFWGYGIHESNFTVVANACRNELMRCETGCEIVVFSLDEGPESDIYKSFREVFDE